MSWQDDGCRQRPGRSAASSNDVNNLSSRLPSSFSDPNSRFGGKGGPWRHMAMTHGARGECVMFVQGDVKIRDMAKFYPSEDPKSADYLRTSPGSPRSIPTLYTNGLAIDPNRMNGWTQQQPNKNSASGRKADAVAQRGGRLHSCKTCRCRPDDDGSSVGNGSARIPADLQLKRAGAVRNK